jgi:hypothetical protein
VTLRDERIDVFAQYSLMRMSNDPLASANAHELLAAVRSGELVGIHKEDQQVPALRAVKMKTWWGTIIPKGEDGALFLDPLSPLTGVPMIIFRDKVRSDKPRIDAALRKALVAFKAWRSARTQPPGVRLDPCSAGTTVTAGLVEIGQAGRPLGNVVPALCAQILPQPALTPRELELIDASLARGEAGVERLTGNAELNADIVAADVFCSRHLSSLLLSDNHDPLLCIDRSVTLRDPRARAIRADVVRQRGPIVHFPALSLDQRMVRAMRLLINAHGYPVNAAAGIVGNLAAESSVIPSRVEQSAAATPLRAPNFAGRLTDFTAREVMNRSTATRTGPRAPGVGLAQWTAPARRRGLFRHTHGGRTLGAAILFNMEAQIDYLVGELRGIAGFAGLERALRAPGVAVNAASDEFVYTFERPARVLGPNGRLPRNHPNVQAVFAERRALSQAALRAFQASPP